MTLGGPSWLSTASLAALAATCLLFEPAMAQEMPFLYPEPMSNITSFRQNVCHQSYLFNSGQLALRDALHGMSLKPVLQLDRFIQMDPETGGIPTKNPGIEIKILDELARRAGFTWRDSFAIVDPPILEKGQTWTDLIVWTAKNFDLSLKWWNQNEIRLGMGVIYPEGWFDASIIMIVKNQEDTSNEMNLAGWLQPFDYTVWLLILATIIVSAFAYMLIQHIDDYHPSEDDAKSSCIGMVYKSAMSFVGQFDLSPTTNAARLMAFSMAFWSVLIMAAYTANFVSFLVVQSVPKMNFETLHDAVAAGVPMCIMATSAMDVAVSSAFQKINLLKVPTEQDVYFALNAGECSIGLSTASAWREYERNSDINGDCDLRWMGRAFKIQQGHFAAFSDSGTLCTNLIRDVVNLHMIEMRADGFIDRAWDDYLDSIADMNCQVAINLKNKKKKSTRLDLNQMMGNFLVHFILMAVSILWAVTSRKRRQLIKDNHIISTVRKSCKELRMFSSKDFTADHSDHESILAESAGACKRVAVAVDEPHADLQEEIHGMRNQLATLVAEVKVLQKGRASLSDSSPWESPYGDGFRTLADV